MHNSHYGLDELEAKEERRLITEVDSVIDGDRILSFSDAIFAFAATLLVLKIDLPNLDASQIATQLPQQLWALMPQYQANFISFLIIGYYWITHHNIFVLVKRYDKNIIWLNILLLIFISFLPFPIDLFGDHSEIPAVIAFYSLSMAVAGYLMAILWWYASHNHRLISSKLSDSLISYYFARFLIAPVIFTISIPLAFVDPRVAMFSWVLVVVILFMSHFWWKKHTKETNDEIINDAI